MDFKVVFKDSFLEDLERIVKSIAIHDPSAAQNLGERVLRAAESLNFFPERHPKVRQRPGTRRFVVGKNFKVFYRIQHASRTIEILRLWDGRRENDPAL